MKLQSIGSTQQIISQNKQVQNQTSFKGDNNDYVHDSWKQNKQDFEDISNDSESPSFIRKVGKAGVAITTGILAYGASKFGISKTLSMITASFSKIKNSALAKKATAKLTGFAKETVVPNFKKAFNSIGNAKISKNVAAKFTTAMNFVKESKVGKFGTSIKSKLPKLPKMPKLPTKAQVKNVATETIAVGSGMAAAMTVSGLATSSDEA